MVTAALFNTLMTGWLFVIGLVIGSFLNVVIARVPHGREHRPAPVEVPEVWPAAHLEGERPAPLLGDPAGQVPGLRRADLLALPGGRAAHRAALPRLPRPLRLDLPAAPRAGRSWSLLVPLTFIDLEHWILPYELTLARARARASRSRSRCGLDAVISSRRSARRSASSSSGRWSSSAAGSSRRRRSAAGDKYLLALLGAFLGAQPLLGVIFLSSLQGALVGSLLLLVRGRAGPAPRPSPAAALAAEAADGRRGDDWVPGPTNIPFGPWLAIAGLEVMLLGDWLADAAALPDGRAALRRLRMKARIAGVAVVLSALATGDHRAHPPAAAAADGRRAPALRRPRLARRVRSRSADAHAAPALVRARRAAARCSSPTRSSTSRSVARSSAPRPRSSGSGGSTTSRSRRDGGPLLSRLTGRAAPRGRRAPPRAAGDPGPARRAAR